MAFSFQRFATTGRAVRFIAKLVVLFVVLNWGSVFAQDAVRSQPGSAESSDLFPPTPVATPAPAATPLPTEREPLPGDDPGPPSDARRPWEDGNVPGASPLLPTDQTRPLSPDRAATGPAELVLDRAAGAFDPTGLGFGRGLPGGAFVNAGNPPVRLGPVALHASAGASVLAEQQAGVFSRTQGWTAGTQLSGSLDAVVGQPLMNRYLEVRYAGSYQIGGRDQYDGTINQAVSLDGHFDFAQLKLLLSGDYTHLTGPDRDVGLAANRDLLAFTFDASYPLSLKSGMDWSISESTSQYADAVSSTEVRTALFFQRRLSTKTRLDVGGTVGTLQVENGGGQIFEQFNLRANYTPDAKFVLSAMVGYEWRQFDGGDTGTPVFSGAISYAVRPTTSLSLGASRSVTNSAAVIQSNYISSTVQVAATQRVGTKFSANLAFGYQNADYRFTEGASGPSREDNYLFVRPSATQVLNDTFSLFLFYSYGKNFSNRLDFQTQQFSLGGRASF